MAKSSRPAKAARKKTAKNKSTARNSRTTVSGPAESDASGAGDIVAEKAAGTQDVAYAFPFNPNKAAEYDPDATHAPPEGASVKSDDPIVGASTVSEVNSSDKVGSGGPNIGQNPTVGPLDRVRVDSTDRVLTTNQGVPIADNQSSLKAALRGQTTSSPPSRNIGTSPEKPIRDACEDTRLWQPPHWGDSTMAEAGTLHDAFMHGDDEEEPVGAVAGSAPKRAVAAGGA
jgi:hypothetical protein